MKVPITIAICDDKESVREYILYLVKSQYNACGVDLYDSGNSLLAANKIYDIYFLDIQMPGLNGIQIAKRLRAEQETQSSIIIFVTVLKEYMEDAFDVKAFHYLIKPIDENKFKDVFARAVGDYMKTKDNGNHIIIKDGSIYHKIWTKDIFYVESKNKKVIINSAKGVMEYYGTMLELESTLENIFFRCHRCYLVNMNCIAHYNSNTIWLKNGDKILLAQKKYRQFVKTFMMFTRSGGVIRG